MEVRCQNVDNAVLLKSVLPKVRYCLLERLDGTDVWVKRLFAEMRMDEILESMVMLLDVIPYGVGKFMLHQPNGKSNIGCWRACRSEDVRVVGNVMLQWSML